MRKLFLSARIAAIALLLATGVSAPVAITRAAAPALTAQLPSITGTVVATPQPVVPATLLLQVGGQTIAVSITAATRLERLFGGVSSLGEFSDGDTVQVIGAPNQSGGITATAIRNQSVQEAFTNLAGTVASINPPATVPATIVLTGLTALGGTHAPYANPLPAQISLPVSGATTITIGGVTMPAAAAIGKLNLNDRVTVVGVYDRFTGRFDSIENIKEAAPPPPTRLQLTGTLAATPSQLSAPVTLCLQGAHVTANIAAPNVAVTSPCPAGQIPVYVTSATTIERMFSNELSALYELSAGDSVRVIGNLVNTQLMATVIQDRAIHLPTVTGSVQSITANGNLTDVTITLATYHGANTPIPVGSQVVLPLTNSSSPNCTAPSNTQFPCTRVTTSAGVTNGYNPGELSVSQTVSASGVYNMQLQRYLNIGSIKAANPSPPAQLQIQGTLAANPGQVTAPITLCVRKAQVTANIATPNVAVTSPCPPGQLPVYVTGSTRIVRRFNGASGLDELSAGDTLHVWGSLVNTQLTATLIKDLSIQEAFTTLVGTVGYVSPFTHPPYFTVRVQHDARRFAPFPDGAVLVVYVGGDTRIITSTGTTNAITAISPGQTVTVLGVYDRQRHSFVDTSRVRIH